MRKTNKKHSVGYKNPPKETQFKKGHSGNPSGRPKRRSSFSETFLAGLEKNIHVTVNGRQQSLCWLEALANLIVLGAAKGDRKMTRLLIDLLSRFDGKNLESVYELRMLAAELDV